MGSRGAVAVRGAVRLGAACAVLLMVGLGAGLHARAQDETATPADSPTAESQVASDTPPASAILGIGSPQSGAIVRGTVSIDGSCAIDGFASYEVAFAYSDNPTDTWFVLQTGQQPVADGTLAVWDTSSITDGTYDLRLRVFLADGTFRVAAVSGVVVGNYTPTETPAPTATFPPTWTPVPIIPTGTSTATLTPPPTATPLPANPASLSVRDVMVYLLFGALAIVVLFGIYGLITWLRDSRS